MSQAQKTSIMVRVQAKGGKFLADDAGGALVTIRDAATGERLGGGVAQGTGSGNLAQTYSSAASLAAIVTPPAAAGDSSVVWWLAPDAGTSGLAVDLDLSRPTLLEITASGPLGGLQSASRATARQWIVPGQVVDQGPGFVVELPGLVVQVMQPATHLAIPSTALPYTVPFEANVTMMCGCQITCGGQWIPSDFVVTAAIGPVGAPIAETVTLCFPGEIPSRFCGSWQLPAGATGFYRAEVTAVQQSTGNTGTGTVTFFVKPAS